MQSSTAQRKGVSSWPDRWYRSDEVWRVIGLRIIPLFAVVNLAWEIVQLPLYTIWKESSASRISYAVVHCTVGDVIIGAIALFAALTMTRSGSVARWRVGKIAALTAANQVAFTVFSEWLNVHVLHSWAYSDLMPIVPLIGTGLSPLVQSIAIPALVILLVLRSRGP